MRLATPDTSPLRGLLLLITCLATVLLAPSLISQPTTTEPSDDVATTQEEPSAPATEPESEQTPDDEGSDETPAVVNSGKKVVYGKIDGEINLAESAYVTRLLDRMEKQGLVERTRSAEDRRIVLVSVTPEGRKRSNRLTRPTMALHEEQMAALTSSELRQLESLLGKLLP